MNSEGNMNLNGMLPKNTFNNKVILITGGGSGLGKSMGKYLVELGAKLIITSRRSEVIDSTANEFNKEYPLKAVFRVMDKIDLQFILAPRVSND